MNADRNIPQLAIRAAILHFGRNVLCAFVAGALTMVLLGEVGQSAAQAAQRAAAEQGISDDAGTARAAAVGVRSVEGTSALI